MQNTFGLTPDGVIGRETWNTMYDAYLGIIETIPIRYTEGNIIPYGGVSLRIGANSEYVRILQEYINYISQTFPEIQPITPTGYFGIQTQEAVSKLQNILGIDITGNVDLTTWNAITGLYSDLYNGSRLNEGQYPGYDIGA
jgi:peptidoglycan hydrolase-like protein with peptidoglycan-binding domain